MNRRLIGLIISTAGTAVLVLLAPLPVSAQAAPVSPVQVRPVPRTAGGKPDLSGFWQAMNTANWDIQARSADKNGPAGLGVVDGDDLPYQPWAIDKKKENYANRLTADTESKCFLPGVPRIMYVPYPFQIVQTPTLVMMFFEYLHATRNVYMDTAHLKGPIEWWMGDSRGRWDGDTLVVDVVHFNNETWFDRAGNFHSEELHVVERYRLTDPDHISYSARIEDPKVFTRPWTMNMVFYRHTEPNFQLLDYECYAFVLNDEPIVAPSAKEDRR
jgi:hypothetical protein